ncbi:Cobalt-precorrin-8 methylmutase [hydrothermal vent metagenome]|uniref:Cobalt-precorrin-8 methylmutase n=1 Tax=hydrothermal vent metagenome TaxID=652676 RepID=A0A3B1AKC1_9ZZZZ
MNNVITEQLTQAGQKIEHDSFSIVDQEVGAHSYQDEQWQVVRRMIHATADFEFNGLVKFHSDAITAGINAINNGANIVADVEMICVGLSKPRLNYFNVNTHHFISDEDVITQAKKLNTTRAVQAMKKAQTLNLLDDSIIAVGNAPTALIEITDRIKNHEIKPALIIGMPVGFVSAAESKEITQTLTNTPWIITHGRKGGSTLVVAAIHALLAIVESTRKNK